MGDDDTAVCKHLYCDEHDARCRLLLAARWTRPRPRAMSRRLNIRRLPTAPAWRRTLGRCDRRVINPGQRAKPPCVPAGGSCLLSMRLRLRLRLHRCPPQPPSSPPGARDHAHADGLGRPAAHSACHPRRLPRRLCSCIAPPSQRPSLRLTLPPALGPRHPGHARPAQSLSCLRLACNSSEPALGSPSRSPGAAARLCCELPGPAQLLYPLLRGLGSEFRFLGMEAAALGRARAAACFVGPDAAPGRATAA